MVFSKLPLVIRKKIKCADLMVKYEGKLLEKSTNLSSLDWKDGESIVVTYTIDTQILFQRQLFFQAATIPVSTRNVFKNLQLLVILVTFFLTCSFQFSSKNLTAVKNFQCFNNSLNASIVYAIMLSFITNGTDHVATVYMIYTSPAF